MNVEQYFQENPIAKKIAANIRNEVKTSCPTAKVRLKLSNDPFEQETLLIFSLKTKNNPWEIIDSLTSTVQNAKENGVNVVFIPDAR